MSQRLVAAFIAVPATLALLVYAWLVPVPYATYQPGLTVDVLASDPDQGGAEIIQVDGHETYPDDGELRMTTVRVSQAADPGQTGGMNILGLLGTWFDGDNAVYPYGIIHAPDETAESNREQGQLEMASSQDAAVEVAMAEAGIDVPQKIAIVDVTPDLPADGVLQVDDIVTTVAGKKVDSADRLVELISGSPAGEPLSIGIIRAGRAQTVEVTPVERDGVSKIGIVPDIAEYEFPFDVAININPAIGGPSAGLIFSLAVYDTLTPGSLTGGRNIAGTGEIYPEGTVAPIGGIQQKIAGARGDGAELFLVPVDNCADALEADNGDMRLMMATTMHDVRVALEAYAADPGADLPSCEDAPAYIAARNGAAG